MPKKSADDIKVDKAQIKQQNEKNKKIIDEFTKLVQQIKFEIDNAPSTSESMTNYYRLRQLNIVLKVIKSYPTEIKKGEELKDIKGIGQHSIDRINEIIKTGKLSEVKIDKELKKYSEYIDNLKDIIGVGPRIAYDFVVNHGIKTVDELIKAHKSGKVTLNNQILLGLKYYNIYKKDIPREEIDEIYNFLNKIVLALDPEIFIIICGSYRRQKMTSNDIDVLITHPKIKTQADLKNKKNYLHEFVNKLKDIEFLLDDLTDKDFEKKYMGFCQYSNKVKKPVRRIDIRYIPYESYYTALLYFTGSDEFNKKMRRVAIQLGYELSEYGLYKINNGDKKRIKIESEKDVFDKLGMEYLEPVKRIG